MIDTKQTLNQNQVNEVKFLQSLFENRREDQITEHYEVQQRKVSLGTRVSDAQLPMLEVLPSP